MSYFIVGVVLSPFIFIAVIVFIVAATDRFFSMKKNPKADNLDPVSLERLKKIQYRLDQEER